MSDAALAKCDCGQAHAAAQVTAPAAAAAHPRGVLATTVLASSLAFVDGSIVNVGLPAIAQSFAADGASLSWVISGYLLPLSALLLLGGAAGDRFGHRRLLLMGVGLFAAASLLCAAAPSLPWLIAARVLQGVGAALLMPTSLAVLGSSFSGEARSRAIGIWAAAGAGAGAIGPLRGGWLIDVVGWRAMFVLITRAGHGGSYWTTTLPAMLVIALGMACAVAPLTNAVLDAVQPAQAGIASGLNSALARTGGLVATALLSFILAAQGAALQHLFVVAMLCGAAAALAAGVCAFVWLKPLP